MGFGESASDFELNGQIRAAQLEAGIKHPHSTFATPKGLTNRIRAAQQQAGARPPETESAVGTGGAPKDCEYSEPPAATDFMAPETFLGKWTDSYGNIVCVYSTDAFETRPMATLSRAPRPDIHLKITPRADGWHCGDAKLDISRSSPTQVCWEFPDGRVSFWTPWQDCHDVQDPYWPVIPMPRHQFQVVPQFFVPVGMVCIQ
mmetsp:Transcript_98359/g.228084  ORF Transcript_98359/g.228084 Transcript_98359/m.228084 type:complete len:203 (-) Transcript_98359:149-757(-)